VRGVDMLRNSWRASVRTELSNASAAWTSDWMGSLFRSVPFASVGNLAFVLVFPSRQILSRLAQHARAPFLSALSETGRLWKSQKFPERIGGPTNLFSIEALKS